MVEPTDEELKAFLALRGDTRFEVAMGFVERNLADERKHYCNIRDDLEIRWSQGRAQALSRLIVAVTEARKGLEDRAARRTGPTNTGQ